MRISIQEVATAFQDLMAGTRSREEVASWASRVRAADTVEGLEYVPAVAESVMWEALEFLMGVDLKDGPNSYLHNQEDLEEYWAAKKGELMG